MEPAFQPKGAYRTLNALEICCLLIQQFLKVIKILLSLFPLVHLSECMYLTFFTAYLGRIWTPIFYLFTVLCSVRVVRFREDLRYTFILLIDLKILMIQTTHEASILSGIIWDDDSVRSETKHLTWRGFTLGRAELDLVRFDLVHFVPLSAELQDMIVFYAFIPCDLHVLCLEGVISTLFCLLNMSGSALCLRYFAFIYFQKLFKVTMKLLWNIAVFIIISFNQKH